MKSAQIAQWQLLEPELVPQKFLIPEDLVVVVGNVSDYRAQLFPEESDYLADMAQVRQMGFASGRHFAHLCQDMLGLVVEPVLRTVISKNP